VSLPHRVPRGQFLSRVELVTFSAPAHLSVRAMSTLSATRSRAGGGITPHYCQTPTRRRSR